MNWSDSKPCEPERKQATHWIVLDEFLVNARIFLKLLLVRDRMPLSSMSTGKI